MKKTSSSSKATISGTHLASVLGITRRRLDQLAADGVLERIGDGYDLEDAVRRYCAWLRRDDETKTERRKLLAAQTAATRLRAQRQTGQLLTRGEVRERLRRFESDLLDVRVVASWLNAHLRAQGTPNDEADRIAQFVHSNLAALIAGIRDRLAERFADVRQEALQEGLERLGVHEAFEGDAGD